MQRSWGWTLVCSRNGQVASFSAVVRDGARKLLRAVIARGLKSLCQDFGFSFRGMQRPGRV